MRYIIRSVIFAFSCAVQAQGTMQEINMQARESNTFYVKSTIQGAGKTSLLVDTGSGYTAINEDTLTRLQKTGDATYLKKLEGVMADGSRLIVPVYRISGMNLGDRCYIRDFEVAVFPAGTREILGLSTLSKVSPFTFSLNPPILKLSNCGNA